MLICCYIDISIIAKRKGISSSSKKMVLGLIVDLEICPTPA
jgi:hypothetical protein